MTTTEINGAFSYLKNLKCGIDHFEDISDEELSFIKS